MQGGNGMVMQPVAWESDRQRSQRGSDPPSSVTLGREANIRTHPTKLPENRRVKRSMHFFRVDSLIVSKNKIWSVLSFPVFTLSI